MHPRHVTIVTPQEEYFHLDRNYSRVSDKQCDSCLLDRPHDSPCILVSLGEKVNV